MNKQKLIVLGLAIIGAVVGAATEFGVPTDFMKAICPSSPVPVVQDAGTP